MNKEIKRSGFVAIIGRPNVGKSTLLNALIGEKISIISPKAQTTRWQILGIKQKEDAQIVYVDTPGIHQENKRAMNRYLNRIASSVVAESDVLVLMINANGLRYEDKLVLNLLKQTKAPVVLVLNKIDLVQDKQQLLPLIDQLKNEYSFSDIIPISALQGAQISQLEQCIMRLLPEGGQLFPEDQVTDKSERFLVAEMIREKLIAVTEEELPYATTVEVEQFKEGDKLTEISAVIWVERQGQKAIVIGKQGLKLKKIGSLARRDIEKHLATKVFLRLWVKVKDNWTDDVKALRSLGYE